MNIGDYVLFFFDADPERKRHIGIFYATRDNSFYNCDVKLLYTINSGWKENSIGSFHLKNLISLPKSKLLDLVLL